MKKTAAFVLCALLAISLFSSCSDDKNTDINYLISFSCEDDSSKWDYEAESEGIVTVSPNVSTGEDGKTVYAFLLESVGDGEVSIVFTNTDSETGEPLRKVSYLIGVDADYKITATVTDDETFEKTVKTVSVRNKADAEKTAEEKFMEENPGQEGNYNFEAKKGLDGKYYVRAFKLSTDKDGNAVMKYEKTLVVDGHGEITETVETGIENKLISTK